MKEIEATGTQMNKREIVLNRANQIVNGDRNRDYGDPVTSFNKIAKLWSAYLGLDISTADVAHMMILMKVSRATTGVYHEDNYVDIAGYAACAAEIHDFGRTENGDE